jgi:hypothetical protein
VGGFRDLATQLESLIAAIFSYIFPFSFFVSCLTNSRCFTVFPVESLIKGCFGVSVNRVV